MSKTRAEIAWDGCAESIRSMPDEMSTRDTVIWAVDSFAIHWDLEFGFRIHDPNDVKELARWVGQHLAAYGVERRLKRPDRQP